jgi:hypothetical protein
VAYRSSRIRAAPGVDVLPPVAPASARTRITNAALDLLATPLCAAAPRRVVTIDGQRVPLHYEFRRWAWRTERCVEIALGLRALGLHAGDQVLEVGNVLPLAGARGHTVVDKYEQGDGVLNVDIVDFDPERSYELVVSISTLEHVGWDEIPQDPDKAAAALKTIDRLGRRLLVTVPVGYHRRFEEAFLAGPFDDIVMLVKTGRSARWEQRPPSDRSRVSYGTPYACGNGILVGMRGHPLTPPWVGFPRPPTPSPRTA